MWGSLRDDRRVCSFQLFLDLARAVVLRSESCRTHYHILLSQTETFPSWRARFVYLYLPGTGWSSYSPRHGVPFSPLKSTLRATVKVFDPPPHGIELCRITLPAYKFVARTAQQTPLLCFSERPLNKNGRCLHSHYLVTTCVYLLA
jgi:hypothetical protein